MALRRFASKHSPFYQRFHRGLEQQPLQALPILTKGVMMEHFDDLVTDRAVRLADAEAFVPLGEALAFLPAIELGEEHAAAASHGVAVPVPGEGEAIRLTHSGRLIGIARPEGDGLKPFVVFPA